jgi:hypothetical protein
MMKRIAPSAIEELLADPEKLRAAVENERRSKLPPPGWSGLSVLARNVNWQLSFALGDGVRQVDVAPRSPAHRAGIRPGNFVLPVRVNGAPVPLEDLDTVPLAAGERIVVEFCRHDRGRSSGWIPVELVLAPAPRARTIPAWKKLRPTSCGPRVRRVERAKFLNKMREHPDVTASMLRALSLALFKYDNEHNPGLWTAYSGWARDLRCSRRTAIEIVNRLRWIGAIKVVEGPSEQRSTNLFQVTWPDKSAPPAVGPVAGPSGLENKNLFQVTWPGTAHPQTVIWI